METYSMEKLISNHESTRRYEEKNGQSMFSLVHVVALVCMVLFTTFLAVYTLLALRAHGVQVGELRAEITSLRTRVSSLEEALIEPREDLDYDDEDEITNLKDIYPPEQGRAENAPTGNHGNELSTNQERDSTEAKVYSGEEETEGIAAGERGTDGGEGGMEDEVHGDIADELLGRRTRQAGNHGNPSQQNPRCRRLQDCMNEPAFAHFEGDIDSAARIHPDRIHPLAWKMMNISGSPWIEFWRTANWLPNQQMSKFTLRNGNVTVHEAGYYFIYSQIQYYDDHLYMGHAIVVNGVDRFRCAESPVSNTRKINTCYIGGLVSLSPNSRVGIKMASPNRVINMHHDSSYFGLYRVAG